MYTIIKGIGVKAAPNPHLKKGVAIQLRPDEFHFHPHDYGVIILDTGGTYKDLFDHTGVTDDSIDACVTYAKIKINKLIDGYEKI